MALSLLKLGPKLFGSMENCVCTHTIIIVFMLICAQLN